VLALEVGDKDRLDLIPQFLFGDPRIVGLVLGGRRTRAVAA